MLRSHRVRRLSSRDHLTRLTSKTPQSHFDFYNFIVCSHPFLSNAIGAMHHAAQPLTCASKSCGQWWSWWGSARCGYVFGLSALLTLDSTTSMTITSTFLPCLNSAWDDWIRSRLSILSEDHVCHVRGISCRPLADIAMKLPVGVFTAGFCTDNFVVLYDSDFGMIGKQGIASFHHLI